MSRKQVKPHLEAVADKLWLDHGHCIAHRLAAQIEPAVRCLVWAVAEHLAAQQEQGVMIQWRSTKHASLFSDLTIHLSSQHTASMGAQIALFCSEVREKQQL